MKPQLRIQSYRILLFLLASAALPVVSVAPAAVSEVVRLAADLNTTPNSSSPSGLTVINDELYLVANDGTHGIELWKTDGTNVTRITDVSYGSTPSFISSPALYNGEIYFRAGSTTNGFIDVELHRCRRGDKCSRAILSGASAVNGSAGDMDTISGLAPISCSAFRT